MILQVACDVQVLQAGCRVVVHDVRCSWSVEERRLVGHELAHATITQQITYAIVRVGKPEVDAGVLRCYIAMLELILVMWSLGLRR